MSARPLLIPFLVVLSVAPVSLAGGKGKEPDSFPKSPPVGPLPQVGSLPKASSTILENGLEVVVVPNSEIPWATVIWYLKSGAKFDSPDKSGLASTTAEMLRKGTQKHSDTELAELLDWHAVSLGASAGHDTTSVSASGPSKQLDLAVQIIAEVVRTPTFPAREFRQHIEQTMSGMAIAEKDGGFLAEREFAARIYGTHYLARLASGTTQTLPGVQRDDVIAFHKTHYMPNQSMVVFSGDVDESRAVEMARKYFGDWATGTPPAPPEARIPEPARTHIFLVDRPDSTQSQIRIGHLGFNRYDPRYVVSQVFNQYFGGGFASRLMRAVRIKEGLTYGAGGGFSAGKAPGTFRLNTFTKNETTAEAVRVLLGEVQNALTVPPTKEELDDAKSYLIGRFVLSMETPQAVAGKVFDLKFYGLPENYYETYFRLIAETPAEQAFQFAKDAINADKLSVIVVGNAEQVKESLSEIAPVTVVKPGELPPAD